MTGWAGAPCRGLQRLSDQLLEVTTPSIHHVLRQLLLNLRGCDFCRLPPRSWRAHGSDLLRRVAVLNRASCNETPMTHARIHKSLCCQLKNRCIDTTTNVGAFRDEHRCTSHVIRCSLRYKPQQFSHFHLVCVFLSWFEPTSVLVALHDTGINKLSICLQSKMSNLIRQKLLGFATFVI